MVASIAMKAKNTTFAPLFTETKTEKVKIVSSQNDWSGSSVG